MLATASNDGLVRLFNISQKDIGQPIIFVGHTAKVFNVEWHPTIPKYFATGSDDKRIIVWNIKDAKEVKELAGHQSNVRALLWNPVIPWILISGSWDATMRVWDIRTQNCLYVCNDHNADVYGVHAHRDRPFLYVSCSRDTSLRFWTGDGLFQGLLFKILTCDSNLNEIIENEMITELPSEKENVKLYGVSSQNLKKELIKMINEADFIGFYEIILKFFKVGYYKNKILYIKCAVL